eukprot:CAMPEP_0181091342 /NCGR_PEP_ID=MMETSP1071-20121207/8347_1 /TAXON_ID=35127 /ORGANISM="Thalassiosira sp., Strain NH16" /LENGTH=188 /DNA_ID=CAMNT_0023173475 /DNA_START=411 /DNA_END=977 /DNA_ORIENTATION=-
MIEQPPVLPAHVREPEHRRPPEHVRVQHRTRPRVQFHAGYYLLPISHFERYYQQVQRRPHICHHPLLLEPFVREGVPVRAQCDEPQRPPALGRGPFPPQEEGVEYAHYQRREGPEYDDRLDVGYGQALHVAVHAEGECHRVREVRLDALPPYRIDVDEVEGVGYLYEEQCRPQLEGDDEGRVGQVMQD